MDGSSAQAVVAGLLALVAGVACRPAAREPPPADVRPAAQAAEPSDSARRRYTEADVRFMHHMTAHHAQALEMTALVPARSRREDIRLIAQRIEVSQRDEIAMMRRWLERRREPVPGAAGQGDAGGHTGASHDSAGHAVGGHEMGGHEAGGHDMRMPGMLTPEEMAQLTAATGAEFDRRFLQWMIRHHEGALTMVAEFFATPGAGQEPEIFRFASDVDADQRAEIARMRALQRASPDDKHRR